MTTGMLRSIRAGLCTSALCALTACGSAGLVTLDRPGEGPDEFMIVPGKPLETPSSFRELPTPTPGGANRTDPEPMADAAVALGGQATAPGAIPAADASLVAEASRFGVDDTIRDRLNTEDADFRRRRGRFTSIRIARVDRYGDVYGGQALDPFREVERWRRSGARTPTSPPQ